MEYTMTHPAEPEAVTDSEHDPKHSRGASDADQSGGGPGPEEFKDGYDSADAWTDSAFVPAPKVAEATAHWSTLIEDFDTSAIDYYAALEAALARRSIPKARIRRVDFDEGGILDARRVYLRVERGELKIDVCAAPFGTGFFFSWWLSGRRSLAWVLVLLTGLCLQILTWRIHGAIGIGTRLMLSVLLFFLTGLGTVAAYRLLKRVTYYAVDTMTMFSTTVHAAVLETIESLTTAKGLRGLTDDERKPIMREFLGK